MAAEGIVKQLGRPAMEPLTVLVREAAQNSWDARTDSGPVDFTIRLNRLGSLTEVWREMLLPPPTGHSGRLLDNCLSEDSLMLIVSDRGTIGLGGPLRAGTRPEAGEKSDFVQFMRNVGEPRDHEYGGGTYGFGKGIFYQLSRAGTILVDTRTNEITPSRRLMGAALGESYYLGEQRYTGRHWWGTIDDIADPVMGKEAESTSLELGLPGFTDSESGTDIVVVGANLGTTEREVASPSRTLIEAAQYIGSSILWNLWPKFIPDEDHRYMRFRLIADGQEVRLPPPESIHDLQPFVEALRHIRTGSGARYTRTVPPKDAGSFSLSLAPASTTAATELVNAARPFTGPPHHVARMRVPELVVDYIAGVQHPDFRLAYGAVFKASTQADAAFALAEPPTHDGWIAGGLTGRHRGVVQNVNRFVAREIASRVTPAVANRTDASGQGLGELSARLGGLISIGPTDASPIETSHNGSEPRKSRKSSRDRAQVKPTLKPRIVGTPVLEIHGGTAYYVAHVNIPASNTNRIVRAWIDVVIEGGRTETDPPDGAALPEIIRWQSHKLGIDPVVGPLLTLQPGEDSEWTLHASYVPDAVVRFRLSDHTAGRGRHAQ